MQVSVIIPVYNKAKYLPCAIESVLAQTIPVQEIIVIDDGSTDAVQDALSPYQDKIVFFTQPNKGVSVARNRGIQESKGEYICFLDADDLWLPTKIERQLTCFSKNSEYGLVYTNGIAFCENDDKGDVFIHDETFKKYEGWVLKYLLIKNFIPTSSVMVKKVVLSQVSHFNPRYKASQDYDLWLRLAKICQFGYVDEILFRYRIVHDGITATILDSMYQDHIDILHEFRTVSGLKQEELKFLQLGIASHYVEWGKDHFFQRHYRMAREKFLTALNYDPYHLVALLYGCCSCLPIWLINVLKRIRKKGKALQ